MFFKARTHTFSTSTRKIAKHLANWPIVIGLKGWFLKNSTVYYCFLYHGTYTLFLKSIFVYCNLLQETGTHNPYNYISGPIYIPLL